MKINLMLHDDWELYGDGSGDINKLMFDPVKKILDLCDKYSAKYTLFAEIGQQLAFLNSTNKPLQQHAKQWEKIVIDAVKRGHDVQLHFHPQWINAFYRKSTWNLDLTKWSIANLKKEEILYWLIYGKKYLESLLQPHNSNYNIVAFRAGGWMVQPSHNLISAMKKAKIICDVTIIKGMILKNKQLGSIDFSDAPSPLMPWIPSDNDMTETCEHYDGFFCIPTYSEKYHIPTKIVELLSNPISVKFMINRTQNRKRQTYKPVYNNNKYQSRTIDQLVTYPNFLGKAFRDRIITCDFNEYHYGLIYRMIKNILHRFKQNRSNQQLKEVPLIILSHSKCFWDCSLINLENLLKKITNNSHINFMRTQDVVMHFDKIFRANNLHRDNKIQ